MLNSAIFFLLIYFILLLLIAVKTHKKRATDTEFYLGERSINSFPLAISIMMTAFSAFNFVVFPSDIAANGLYIVAALPAFFLVIIPIRRWLIPFFHKNKDISAYQFLAERNSPRVHKLASSLFILWRVLWIGFSLYATAKVTASLLELPFWLVIVIAGLIATLYSSIGGIRAVIWTDILQFIILFAAITTIILLSFKSLNLSDILAKGLFKPYTPLDSRFFSFDPQVRITLPSALIGSSVAFLARYGADQMIIQRYKAAKSLQEAKSTILLNACIVVVILMLLIPFGLAIRSFIETKGLYKIGMPPITYFILFVKSQPVLIKSLLLTAMIAATMSSVDSGINAITASLTQDFNYKSTKDSQWKFTFAVGLGTTTLGIILIPILANNKTLFVIINKIINGFGSPLLALILCSFLKSTLSEKALFWGTIVGAVFSCCSVFFLNNISVHYYSVVNFLVTLLLIYSVSLFSKLKDKSST